MQLKTKLQHEQIWIFQENPSYRNYITCRNARFSGNSEINMKCNRLLWEEILFAQGGTCFFSFPYPSSFCPKQPDVHLWGPKIARGANVKAPFEVTLIKNSGLLGPRWCMSEFFCFNAKFSWKLNYSKKISQNGWELRKLWVYLDKAILIN